MNPSTMLPAFLVAFALLAAPALARQEATPLAEDPVVEQRLVQIASELRCLVCQNEALADSRAPLAEDLRREVRELIKQGKTDRQVKDFLVDRYGEFVLYRPEFKPATWPLWIGPFVLLLIGLFALLYSLKKRGTIITDKPLSEEDRRRAEALLNAATPGFDEVRPTDQNNLRSAPKTSNDKDSQS